MRNSKELKLRKINSLKIGIIILISWKSPHYYNKNIIYPMSYNWKTKFEFISYNIQNYTWGNLINRLDSNDSLRCKIKANSKEPIEIEVNKLKLFSKMLNTTSLNKNSSLKL